ncbi:MAG TPA: hypothetical protein VF752_08370 [Thermoleophilaceae bacterium]
MTQEGQEGGQRQPTEEELRAALEEQMRKITVRDVVLQTVVSLVNLSGRRLGLTGAPEEKDLEQARLGIDAVRALLPLLPDDEMAPVRDALSQLQVAYAREAGGGAGQEQPAEDQPSEPSAEDQERAKARSKIWTPPGT